MFCVSPVFHEREMHLLNLEVSDSFNGDFIRVSKVIINICAIVAFMIPQHEIANFYWFIYLIQTFTENALKRRLCCARKKEKKHENKRKENKSSNMMHFREMRASNTNHKDFIVIQNVYDFFSIKCTDLECS